MLVETVTAANALIAEIIKVKAHRTAVITNSDNSQPLQINGIILETAMLPAGVLSTYITNLNTYITAKETELDNLQDP